jgi:PAS domain S-box-containing protein
VNKDLQILVLEDVEADVFLINHELRRGGFTFHSKRVETRDDFVHEIESNPPDVILSDHGLPSFDGFSALSIAREKCPDTPFIFVTGSMGEEVAIDSLRKGATDYVLKGRLPNLGPAVRRALCLTEERARRKQAERDLRASEERFRMLVEDVDDYAIFMLDPHGQVIIWNVGAERIYGYRADEVIGKKFNRFYPRKDRDEEKPEQALAAAVTEGSFRDEGWQMRKDSSRYWGISVITALRDEKGQLSGFSVITRDISMRKEAEDEIRRLNTELEQRVEERTAELQEAYHEMEAFSYSISHDLRAPLIHISGFAELLTTDAEIVLDEKARRYLQTITKSAKRMGKMIDDLLAFSRTSRAELHKVRVNMAEIVRSVREDLQPEMQSRTVIWKVDSLPDVQGDPFLLRQAVFNLVSNALKYTRTREEARIEIGSAPAGGETLFFVRDNGVGFNMEYSAKLFGVFQRLHSTSEFEGTGIGLANVRSIIKRHGGRTWAESVLDHGATFYFSLPDATKTPDAKGPTHPAGGK